MKIPFIDYFRPKLSTEDRHLQISERLGIIAKELSRDGDDEVVAHTAACLNFLAVLCGSEDKERLLYTARAANRWASEALEEYAEPEPKPEETLRRLIEKGIDIACGAMYCRNWTVATEGLAKLVFLDDLSKKVASGEEVLKERPETDWPDVIGTNSDFKEQG